MGVLRAPGLVPLGATPPSRRLAAHLKKSSLQYTLSPRLKQRSASGAWQSLHLRHLLCQWRSRALRMKRSRMCWSQPAHSGISAGREEPPQSGPPHRAGGLPIPPSSQDRAAGRPPSRHTLVPGRLEWLPSSPSSGRVWLGSLCLARSGNPGQLKLGLETSRGRRAPRPPLQIPSTAKTFPVHEGRTLSSNETLAPGAVSEAGLETGSLPSPEARHTWAVGHPPPRGPHSSHNQAPWHLETCGRCGCLALWPVPGYQNKH